MTKTRQMKNDHKNKKTWQEKILDCLGDKKWKSHHQIHVALGLDVRKNKNHVKAINSYLRRLIRSGCIVRANAPDVIKTDPLDHIKFVYKKTDKEFRHYKGLHPRPKKVTQPPDEI